MRFHLKRTVVWVALSISVSFVIYVILFNNGRPISVLKNHNLSVQSIRQDITYSTKKAHITRNKSERTGDQQIQFQEYSPVKLHENSDLLWPNRNFYDNDRIVNQLKFKIKNQNSSGGEQSNVPLKMIFIDSGFGNKPAGRKMFLDDHCNVDTCEISRNPKYSKTADALFFGSAMRTQIYRKDPNQIWIIFMLESPYSTMAMERGFASSYINWTATYRHDSDIVAPYEKFVPHDENVKFLPQNKSYAKGKSKQVAWFVSNCGARNERREYARELAKFIQVDIYGKCGPLKCPRNDKRCSEMLNKSYKFYLAFENSNCRDYITEKFFVTGLQHDVIPIVMGAAPEDYARTAPPHSFIHVDDFESPEQLAQYLHKLDQNDDLYNAYFRWKGTGSFINTFFWCRICAMLHDTSRESHSYRDLEKWWRGDGVCIGKDNWRKRQRTSNFIVQDYLA